jgi:hypothetical protein
VSSRDHDAVGSVISLDVALDRLIHRRSCRADFLDGNAVFDLREPDCAVLRALDPRTLVELGTSVAMDLICRKHVGSGSLFDLYPRTIEAFRRRHGRDDDALELAYAFMDSAAFDRYREFPHAGAGTTLEEAFYRFAEAEDLGDAVVREAEFLAAMAKLVCANPRIDASLPAELRRAARGHYAVSARGAPVLYGALHGRFVTGPLTPFLADLLVTGADHEKTAARHGVSKTVLAESLRRLSELGIL